MGCKSNTFYLVQQFLFGVSEIRIGRKRPSTCEPWIYLRVVARPLKKRCFFGKILLDFLRVANAQHF